MMQLQKLMTAMAMPVALVWLAMLACSIAAWRLGRRRTAWTLAAATLLYWIGSNGVAAGWLIERLERPYLAVDPMTLGVFDAVFVLGGGTGMTLANQAQLTGGGDRVMLAARLHRAGRAAILVATGEPTIPDSPPRPGPAEQARRIWGELGIAQANMRSIGGRTTREELRAAAELASSQSWRRVGLITSAWHMNRAMRLAGEAGLKAEPIPCDFATTGGPFRWTALLPSGAAMAMTERAMREMLAGLVGR
jgi:uncharacterized SAM-binding protein YcdF (DUF218 family)